MRDLKKNLYPYFKYLSPLLILSLLVGIFFWKVFFKGYVPFPGDFVVGIYYPWLDYKWGHPAGVPVKNPIVADVPSFMYPMQTFAVSQIKKGEWPLWNPYILGGAPLLANFQSAPLSPTNLGYFFLNYAKGWTVQIILAHILAAFFVYLLLSYWKVSKVGSILGGIVFSFSGFNLIWSQWNGHVLTAAFIPLLILFSERFIGENKIRYGIGLSLTLALQIFSGYPQVVIYSAVSLGIVILLHFNISRKYFFSLIKLAFFLTIGFGLSMVQLFASAELLSLSQWSAEPHPKLWAFLPWEKTITFLAPDYFGNHATGNYWGPQDYTSNTGFVGTAVVALSLFGIFYLKKKKSVQIAFALVVFSLILSFPTPLATFLWANDILGMRSSSAHRALALFNLGCALLSAFGFDYLKEKTFSLKKIIKVCIPVFATLGIFAYLASNNFVAIKNLVFPSVVIFVLFLVFILIKQFKGRRNYFFVLVFFLVVFELYRFGWKFTPFSEREFIFPKTPAIEFLTQKEKPFRVSMGNTMPVNFHMAYGIETLAGYETMRPFQASQFIASLNNKSAVANPSGRYGIIDNDTSHLLDLVNTKYYLTLKADEKGSPDQNGKINTKFDKDRFSLVFEDKTTAILESKSALPRAFLVDDWIGAENDTKALEFLLDESFPLSKKIIISDSSFERSSKSNVGKNMQSVKFVHYGVQKSEIETQSKEDSMLFVSDAWYPGWKAYIDGIETKIYRADYAFRAVFVPKGEHRVLFLYKPESFSKGLTLSLLSLGIVLALSVFDIYLGRYKR